MRLSVRNPANLFRDASLRPPAVYTPRRQIRKFRRLEYISGNTSPGKGYSRLKLLRDRIYKRRRAAAQSRPPQERKNNMAAITVIHEKYMKEALKQAKKAYALGEVPIGCVIVHQGKIIGRGYNRRNTDKNTLAHAEITAIRKASKIIGDWRLEECTIYITLEPCQMCAGAIIQARIPEVVMGCMNPKAGCGGSLLNILEDARFNHQAVVTRGILEQECSELLKLFFSQLRERNKLEKKTLAKSKSI